MDDGNTQYGIPHFVQTANVSTAQALHPLLPSADGRRGASYKEIARRVTLAPATVRNVVQVTYRKLGINNKAQLARLMAKSQATANGAAL